MLLQLCRPTGVCPAGSARELCRMTAAKRLPPQLWAHRRAGQTARESADTMCPAAGQRAAHFGAAWRPRRRGAGRRTPGASRAPPPACPAAPAPGPPPSCAGFSTRLNTQTICRYIDIYVVCPAAPAPGPPPSCVGASNKGGYDAACAFRASDPRSNTCSRRCRRGHAGIRLQPSQAHPAG